MFFERGMVRIDGWIQSVSQSELMILLIQVWSNSCIWPRGFKALQIRSNFQFSHAAFTPNTTICHLTRLQSKSLGRSYLIASSVSIEAWLSTISSVSSNKLRRLTLELKQLKYSNDIGSCRARTANHIGEHHSDSGCSRVWTVQSSFWWSKHRNWGSKSIK